MDSWVEYRHEIDRRLDAVRPERCGANEKDWREPIYGWARNHIPDESNLVRRFAEKEVNNRERIATTRGNKLLRGWLHGRVRLAWRFLGPLPVVVGKVRIRLDAATPDDLEDAARELEERGRLVFNEVLLLVGGLRDLARAARRQGLLTVSLIGDLAPCTPFREGFLPYEGPDDEISDVDDDDDE